MTYGTGTTSPAWMYPLDGNRFAVGTDPAHLGGDVWTTDAAIEMMENETDWRGMMVTLGSVDKAAHMWGTDDDGPSGVGDDTYEQAHLPFAARTADVQVGRLLAALDAQGIRDETLVVLTTDHAGQTAHRYHGQDGAGPRQLQLVLRRGLRRDVPAAAAGARAARGHGQRRLQLPGRPHRHVAARPLAGEAGRGGRGDPRRCPT